MSEQQQTLTIQQAIDLGVQHQKAGRLPEAESICRSAVAPREPRAMQRDAASSNRRLLEPVSCINFSRAGRTFQMPQSWAAAIRVSTALLVSRKPEHY